MAALRVSWDGLESQHLKSTQQMPVENEVEVTGRDIEILERLAAKLGRGLSQEQMDALVSACFSEGLRLRASRRIGTAKVIPFPVRRTA